MTPVDIVVTTPARFSAAAAREAADCIAAGGGFYFRRVPFVPRGVGVGSRLFYVERGFLVGFARVVEICDLRVGEEPVCATTGLSWPPGHYVFADATTWRWIRPVAMAGFRGVRRLHPGVEIVEVGGWRDPRPWLSTSIGPLMAEELWWGCGKSLAAMP